MFILDHNFWTRNARISIKGSKDSDSSLVSNENFSETLWPSGWALDQATWAKMTPKLLHLWRQSQKIRIPQAKNFFECNLLEWSIRLRPWTPLCTRKKILGWGFGFFVTDVISEIVLGSFWLMLPGLGPNR